MGALDHRGEARPEAWWDPASSGRSQTSRAAVPQIALGRGSSPRRFAPGASAGLPAAESRCGPRGGTGDWPHDTGGRGGGPADGRGAPSRTGTGSMGQRVGTRGRGLTAHRWLEGQEGGALVAGDGGG